jgi:hypothetical protein
MTKSIIFAKSCTLNSQCAAKEMKLLEKPCVLGAFRQGGSSSPLTAE